MQEVLEARSDQVQANLVSISLEDAQYEPEYGKEAHGIAREGEAESRTQQNRVKFSLKGEINSKIGSCAQPFLCEHVRAFRV